MKPRRHQAILFDLDGTLVESLEVWVDLFLERLEAWGVHGFTRADYFEKIYGRSKALPDVLDEVGIGRENTEKFRAERDALYLAHLANGIRWIEGAREVLDTIRTEPELRLGIVTGAQRAHVNAMNVHIGIYELVETTVASEDMGDHQKPEPHGLLLAAKTLDVDPARCIYAGDQPIDVEAAQAAGMESVLIPRPTTHRMPNPPADHTLDGLNELPTILDLR